MRYHRTLPPYDRTTAVWVGTFSGPRIVANLRFVSPHPGHWRPTRLLRAFMHQIGNTAMQRRDYTKAARYLRQVPKRLVDGGTPLRSREVLEVSVKLAGCYYAEGKTTEAASGTTIRLLQTWLASFCSMADAASAGEYWCALIRLSPGGGAGYTWCARTALGRLPRDVRPPTTPQLLEHLGILEAPLLPDRAACETCGWAPPGPASPSAAGCLRRAYFSILLSDDVCAPPTPDVHMAGTDDDIAIAGICLDHLGHLSASEGDFQVGLHTKAGS